MEISLLYETETIFPLNLFAKVPRIQQEAKECAREFAFEHPRGCIFIEFHIIQNTFCKKMASHLKKQN